LAQSKVEDALFGINHDGQHTNWFRNAVTGTSLPGSATESDGLFFDVGADGNGGGGAPYDFAAWSGPTWTNTVNVIGPTNFLARVATTTADIFKRPPFDSGTAAGGDPANTVVNPTPSWTRVEVSQVQTVKGNLITWKMNNTVILSYITTDYPGPAAAATNGTIMLGYCDPWDDLGNTTAGSGEGAVIYDNVQVVQLTVPEITQQPVDVQTNVGGIATFSVVASTSTGITNYQWYRNATAIAGATNSSLVINPVTTNTFNSIYAVLVSDGAYSVWSSNATVTAVAPGGPTIVTAPQSMAAVVGSSPTFSVTATTTTGVTNYQWMYYGTNLSAATASTLTLTNVQPISFGGPYTVSVSDGSNSVTSTPPAILTMAVAPPITSPSHSGTNFTLMVATEVGPSYVLDYKSSLTNAAWAHIVTNIGTGGTVTFTDGSAAPEGFYRIRLQ
jgi:hypothetical protein